MQLPEHADEPPQVEPGELPRVHQGSGELAEEVAQPLGEAGRVAQRREVARAGAPGNASRPVGLLSRTEAYRDVEYFREQLRLPITYDPRQGGYCYSEANAPLSPLITVSEGELLALYVSQRVLEQYEGTQYAALLAGAFQKISAYLKTRQVRTFNLSRVRKAQVQAQPFERRKDFDLKAYMRDGFSMMRGEAVEQVSIRFDAEQARYVQERTWHPTERRERQPDGGFQRVRREQPIDRTIRGRCARLHDGEGGAFGLQ